MKIFPQKYNTTSDKIKYYSANGIIAGAKTAATGYALSSLIDIFNEKNNCITARNMSQFANNTGKFGIAICFASVAVFLGANLLKEI